MIPGEILFAPLQATLGKALSDIVVQFTLVVGALSNDKMFTPFLTILTQTDKASVSYSYCIAVIVCLCRICTGLQFLMIFLILLLNLLKEPMIRGGVSYYNIFCT